MTVFRTFLFKADQAQKTMARRTFIQTFDVKGRSENMFIGQYVEVLSKASLYELPYRLENASSNLCSVLIVINVVIFHTLSL